MTIFWSITLISAGFISPNIDYIGNSQSEILCQKSVEIQQFPQQPKNTDKNKEYVCVQWLGSSDPYQNQPIICLKWELKDKPWFRKT